MYVGRALRRALSGHPSERQAFENTYFDAVIGPTMSVNHWIEIV